MAHSNIASSDFDGQDSIHTNDKILEFQLELLAANHLGGHKPNDKRSVSKTKAVEIDTAQSNISGPDFPVGVKSPRPATEDSPSLLTIPPELRLMIYPYLLQDRYLTHIGPRNRNNSLHKSHNKFHPNILRTCQLIYNEALPMLYGNNGFVINLNFGIDGVIYLPPKLPHLIKHLTIHSYIEMSDWTPTPEVAHDRSKMIDFVNARFKTLDHLTIKVGVKADLFFDPHHDLVRACAAFRTVKKLVLRVDAVGSSRVAFTESAMDALKASLVADGSVEGRVLRLQVGEHAPFRTFKARGDEVVELGAKAARRA